MNKEMKNTAYYKAKAGIDLTKKPVGPIAEKKKKESLNEAAIRTEGPEKLQTVRRKGLIPGSQKFNPKRDQDFGFINYEDPSDPDRG